MKFLILIFVILGCNQLDKLEVPEPIKKDVEKGIKQVTPLIKKVKEEGKDIPPQVKADGTSFLKRFKELADSLNTIPDNSSR